MTQTKQIKSTLDKVFLNNDTENASFADFALEADAAS